MLDLERLTSALAPLYRPERELARTPLGVTWLAHTSDGAAAAVCVVTPELVDGMRDADAFVRTMERAARVTHPGLVPLLGAGTTAAGDLYFAMPWLPGSNAAERLEAEGPLPAGEVATLGAQVADALAAAHESGVLHGALSPDAIRLTGDGPRLAGLGLWHALVAAGVAPLRAAELTGALACVSPEQTRGGHAEVRSDVYGLGATLFELLTGKPPFGGRTTSFVIASVLSDEPSPNHSLGPGAGGGSRVTDTVLRAIEKAPEDRWPSAAAFARALHQGEKTPPEGVAEMPRPRAGRWMLVGGALVVLVAVAALLLR